MAHIHTHSTQQWGQMQTGEITDIHHYGPLLASWQQGSGVSKPSMPQMEMPQTYTHANPCPSPSAVHSHSGPRSNCLCVGRFASTSWALALTQWVGDAALFGGREIRLAGFRRGGVAANVSGSFVLPGGTHQWESGCECTSSQVTLCSFQSQTCVCDLCGEIGNENHRDQNAARWRELGGTEDICFSKRKRGGGGGATSAGKQHPARKSTPCRCVSCQQSKRCRKRAIEPI